MERSGQYRGDQKSPINSMLDEESQSLITHDLPSPMNRSFFAKIKDNIKGNTAAVVSCLMYSGCSISMVLANKAISMTLSPEERKLLPDAAIVMSQCLVAVILVSIAKTLKYVDYPELQWPIVKQWLPLNILFLAMLTTGFLSLVHASVPMVTIFKNVTNLFTVFGDWYLFKEPASYLTVVSIGMMLIGAILAGANDLEFTFLGYFWMTLNCLCTSAYVLYMRYASSSIKLSKFGMVYYNNILSVFIMLPILFLRGEVTAMANPIFWKPEFLIANLLAGVMGFYLNFASLWCVGATSATTYAIVGSVNKVPITVLGFVLFHAQMTQQGVMFVVFATLGGFLYAYSKLPK